MQEAGVDDTVVIETQIEVLESLVTPTVVWGT